MFDQDTLFRNVSGTGASRKFHGNYTGYFTLNQRSSGYSGFVMQGAFVVQLRMESPEDKLSGRVEEVDTGRVVRFQSEEELLEFLRRTQLDERGAAAVTE